MKRIFSKIIRILFLNNLNSKIQESMTKLEQWLSNKVSAPYVAGTISVRKSSKTNVLLNKETQQDKRKIKTGLWPLFT